jgi:hypothetical protein
MSAVHGNTTVTKSAVSVAVHLAALTISLDSHLHVSSHRRAAAMICQLRTSRCHLVKVVWLYYPGSAVWVASALQAECGTDGFLLFQLV